MSNPDPPRNQDPKSSETVEREPTSTSSHRNAPATPWAWAWEIGSRIHRKIGTCGIVAVIAGILAFIAISLLALDVGLDLAGIDKCQLPGKYLPCYRTAPPGGSPTPAVTPTKNASAVAGNNYSSFIEAARKADKAYIIEGATMFGDITDTKHGQETTRAVSWFVTYTVRALKDISLSSRPVFHETYQLADAELFHWSGTEQEENLASAGEYDVAFDLKEGELRTFTTGVDYSHLLPMENNHLAFDGKIPLNQNQDYFSYSNPSGADYICHLTIIVRSKTTKLEPGRAETSVRLTADKPLAFSSARFSPLTNKNGWHTLSASWSYVYPDEEVGIVFQWP